MKITRNISECPWTSWNIENRRILIFFMMNVHKPLIVGSSNIFVCEYPFIIKVKKIDSR
jgi:hypothetical protein